jgi:hypothetical protein
MKLKLYIRDIILNASVRCSASSRTQLAIDLGLTQQAVSLLEQKETLDPQLSLDLEY